MTLRVETPIVSNTLKDNKISSVGAAPVEAQLRRQVTQSNNSQTGTRKLTIDAFLKNLNN